MLPAGNNGWKAAPDGSLPITMRRSYDLLVLGAGPAGLATAWRAARRGLSVAVVERTDTVGGTAASFEVAGVRVDQGSHRLHAGTPPHILEDLRGLLGDDLQLRHRNGRLHIADRWVRSPPESATSLARELPGNLVAGLARDAALRRLHRIGGDDYAEVLRNGLGPTLYTALHGPYAEKLWGLAGERLSPDQARFRLASDSPMHVVTRLLRGRGDGAPRTSYYYPRRGFGQIVEALAEAAVKDGADVLLESEVAGLVVIEDRVTVTTQDDDELSAAYTFSTMPLPQLARLARPAPSLVQLEAAGRLRFRAVVLVYLVHEGGRWLPYDSQQVPGPRTPIARLSEAPNYRDNPDDPTDRSVVCAEIPCAMTDDVWGMSDESLGDLVEEGLARIGLPTIHRGHAEARRIGHAYPIYVTGYERELEQVDHWARDLRRVVTLGGQGVFAPHDTRHSLVMAYDAIEALRADGRFDRYAWTAARERFAQHVVEE
jgi:protoporphyrinogen oxidase